MPTISKLIEGLKSGAIVPYLGPGVLKGVVNKENGKPIPADNESLILAMTGGKPMSPRLMVEFSRAAMHMEHKKGRKFLEGFLTKTYGETHWSQPVFHTWLANIKLPYIVDSNRDQELQHLYRETPHTLIIGVARLAAHPYRFDIYDNSDGSYKMIKLNEVNKNLPIIFKPMGSPLPKPSFVASDADFVDYITELMGGFAIPNWLKDYRKNRQYLLLGMRFTRDTERMILSDIIYSASQTAGWAFIPQPTDKERRYLADKNIEIIESDWNELIQTSTRATAEAS